MARPRMSQVFNKPVRKQNLKSSKRIFISCEGWVTEEEYFDRIMDLYKDIGYKIELISVREDLIAIPSEERTKEQTDELTSSSPEKLVENIDIFKSDPKKIKKYRFDDHPDDEFWVVADVDKHTADSHLSGWVDMMKECRSKKYKLAVSNPFFELWLLLHHDDANLDTDDENNDAKWAVTDEHKYLSTDHFRKRLSDLGFPLISNKHINKDHYYKEKVKDAVRRASELDTPPCSDYPRKLGTTVYRLLESIVQIDEQFSI